MDGTKVQKATKADDSNEPSAFRVDGKVLLFLSPPEGDTGADTGSHTDREEYPPHAARRSRFGRLGSGFRGGLGRGGGGRGGACLNFRNGDRFRLGAAADRADALLLAFLAFRRLLRDGPVSKGMRAGFREELAAAGIFLRVLRLGDGPFRHAAVHMVRAVDIAVSLAADLALCPPEAGRRAAGMSRGRDHRAGAQQSIAVLAVCIAGIAVLRAGRFHCVAHLRAAGMPRGGDHRAGGQQGIAVLAVCIAGIARCRAGRFHRAADLFVAGVVVGVKIAPLVYIRLRSLVVAGAAVLVVHRLRDAGGRRRKVHIAQPEPMVRHCVFSVLAIVAGVPVAILVVPVLPWGTKMMLRMVVLSAANVACARHAAVRSAAVAVSRFCLAAAIAPTGAGVGVVAVGRPCSPVMAEYAIFSAAQLAGFACGAGGRFGAASVFKHILPGRELIFIIAVRTFNACPMILWVRSTADRGGKELNDWEISFPAAVFAFVIKHPRRRIVRRRRRRHPRQKIQQQHGGKDRDPEFLLHPHTLLEIIYFSPLWHTHQKYNMPRRETQQQKTAVP